LNLDEGFGGTDGKPHARGEKRQSFTHIYGAKSIINYGMIGGIYGLSVEYKRVRKICHGKEKTNMFLFIFIMGCVTCLCFGKNKDPLRGNGGISAL